MLTEDSIISTFVIVDDFYLEVIAGQLNLLPNKPRRGFSCGLNASEVITILLCFQKSHFRNFKQFYLHFQGLYKYLFPGLVSYSRFVTLMKDVSVFMFVFVNVLCKSGDLLSFSFSSGNTDDRVPVPELCKKLFGKLFGDRGYISKELFEALLENGIQLITNIKSNMKNKLIPIFDKLVLRKRFIFDLLKNEFHLEYSRHRSPKNFVVNILSVLAAYCLRPDKPAIIMSQQDSRLLAAC